MALPEFKARHAVPVGLAVFLALGSWWLLSRARDRERLPISVVVPPLSELAMQGRRIFDVNCAGCHGVSATGTDQGPPLVHDIYKPGHHADGAFYLAAKVGVRQHHWRFGNMPSQPHVSEFQMKAVIQYIRELQVANGIASSKAASRGG